MNRRRRCADVHVVVIVDLDLDVDLDMVVVVNLDGDDDVDGDGHVDGPSIFVSVATTLSRSRLPGLVPLRSDNFRSFMTSSEAAHSGRSRSASRCRLPTTDLAPSAMLRTTGRAHEWVAPFSSACSPVRPAAATVARKAKLQSSTRASTSTSSSPSRFTTTTMSRSTSTTTTPTSELPARHWAAGKCR